MRLFKRVSVKKALVNQKKEICMSPDKALILKEQLTGQQYLWHLGAYQKCKILPDQNLLPKRLHFNKVQVILMPIIV